MSDMDMISAEEFDRALDAGEPVELSVNLVRPPRLKTPPLYTVSSTTAAPMFNASSKASKSREVWGFRAPASANL